MLCMYFAASVRRKVEPRNKHNIYILEDVVCGSVCCNFHIMRILILLETVNTRQIGTSGCFEQCTSDDYYYCRLELHME